MDLQPLLDKGWIVTLHVSAATSATVLGAFVLWRRKGGRWHRIAGSIWVSLMLVVSFTAFGISSFRTFGPFSPIHILAVTTPICLFTAIRAARAGNIATHRATMQAIYVGGCIVAGAFTLAPGRTLHKVLFGRMDAVLIDGPWWILPLTMAALVSLWFSRRERARR